LNNDKIVEDKTLLVGFKDHKLEIGTKSDFLAVINIDVENDMYGFACTGVPSVSCGIDKDVKDND